MGTTNTATRKTTMEFVHQNGIIIRLCQVFFKKLKYSHYYKPHPHRLKMNTVSEIESFKWELELKRPDSTEWNLIDKWDKRSKHAHAKGFRNAIEALEYTSFQPINN